MQQPCRLLHRGLSHSGTKRRPVLCDPLGLRAPFSALHAPPLWVARPSPSAGASQTAAHFRRSQGLSQARPSGRIACSALHSAARVSAVHAHESAHACAHKGGREGGPETHMHTHTHTNTRVRTHTLMLRYVGVCSVF